MSNQHLQNWINASALVDEIQDEVLEAKSIEALFKILVKSEALKGLIPRKELSIVYHAYGSEKPEFWVTPDVIRERKTNDFGGTNYLDDEPKHTFSADLGCIKQVIDDAKAKPVINPENAPYRNFVIIPMRLNKDKNIGAFILHNDKEKASYDSELIKALDAISNRLAYFIRHNVRKRRIDVFQRVQLSLYRKHFKSECEIIDQFVSALSDWFEHDEIIILIKHPLDTKRFVTACCSQDGKEKGNKPHAKQDFRLTDPLSDEQLKHIFGDTREKLADNAIELTSEQAIKDHNIGLACKSWLGTPMRLKKGVVIGYLIMHNKQENAFEHGEEKFVDGLSDYVASLIGTHRHDTIIEILREIRDFEITGKSNDLKSLYDGVLKSISHLFGIQAISIYRFDRSQKPESQFREIAFHSKQNENINIPEDVKDEAFKITLEHNKNIDKDKARIHKNFNVKSKKNGICYFVAPMRIRQRSLGCFIFEASHISSFTAQSIDDVADTLAEKVAANTRWQRDQLISEFGTRSSKEAPATQAEVINLAHEFISKAMYTENLYIALYNKEKNEINFPFALKNGKTWKSIQDSIRTINDNKLGKTEWIIRNKEPLFHQTQAEALEWYDEPKHKEHGGNPLASWVGVPIFSERGVIGVIAAYHDELDNIYLKRDIFFLTNIANQISGLFRALYLQEAHKKIADQQHALSTALLSHDLTHRLKNSIGAISINIKQTVRDIEAAKSTGNMDHFKYTLKSIDDINKMIDDLIGGIRSISEDDFKDVFLNKLLEKIVKQVRMTRKLESIDADVFLNIPNKKCYIKAHYRSIFNALHAIIDNAAEALVAAAKKIHPNDLKLEVTLYHEDDFFLINIADTGISIPIEIKANLFEYGNSNKASGGFGLWRSKTILNELGGNISYQDGDIEKKFIINLPNHNCHKKSIVILDDESSWRNILNRWFSEEGFEVYLASTIEDFLTLLKSVDSPDYISLDVSLDKHDASNVDGLSMIRKIKESNPLSHILIITGHKDTALSYQEDVALTLDKISDDGNVLNKESLLAKMRRLEA